MKSYKKEIIKNIIGALLGLLLLFGVLFEIIYDFSIKQEVKKARLISDVIIDFRRYLSNVSPYVKIPNNLNPFACTPAYVVDRVSQIIRDKNHFLIRQVSDKYRNSQDKPNELELSAIEYFKTHPTKEEFFKKVENNQNKQIFYARVLRIKPSCLKCHGDIKKDIPPKLYKILVKHYGNRAFNYKVGDVRGIISIYTPFDDVISVLKYILMILGISFIVIFVVGTFLFKRVSDNIREDVEKIINHFKDKVAKRKLSKFKEKMHYEETDILKKELNKVIKELKNNQRELYKKYYYSPLTNLFNRTKFLQIEHQKKYPLVILNIDKFREINNYFGIEIADKLIKKVAKRLEGLKRVYRFKLYHIFIDEFLLLFSGNIENREKLKEYVEEIIKELEKNYLIDNYEISIRFRAGISFEKRDYLCAEIALEATKDKNIAIEFCDNVKEYFEEYKKYLEWIKRLKKKINSDRIVPFYQPIVDKDKKIIKYESLVRIITFDNKIISPGHFLDIAKKTRFYLDITKIVINKTMENIKKHNVAISINLSLEDIENKKIREFIFNKIMELENKSLLTIEIVETENVRDSKEVFEFLKRIKNLGVEIYIDDFGSGYANFDYLFRLTPSGVKIDGSLIKNILENDTNQKIVKTIIAFAKEVNIKVVAEYIENKEVFEYLKGLGIDYFQGYYFSPPRKEIIDEI